MKQNVKHKKHSVVCLSLLLWLLMLLSCDGFMHSSQAQRMQSLLLQAEEMNQNYVMMDTLSFMPEVLDYFKHHGTEEECMRANYMMGCVFRDRGDYPRALVYYHDATRLVDTLSCNHSRLSRIYGQMASLFHQQRFPQKELSLWKDCRKHALQAGDSLMATGALSMMGSVYMHLKMNDSALSVLNQVSSDYKTLGRIDLAASSLGSRAWFYLQCDSLNLAKKDIDEYIVNSGYFEENGDVAPGREIFFYFQGLYYEKIQRMDSALYFYRKLVSFPHDIQNLENGYKGMMSVFCALGQIDSVKHYAILYKNANDTANFKYTANEISRAEMIYNYSESQRNVLDKSRQTNLLWHICYSLFIVIATIVIFGTLYIKRMGRKHQWALVSMNEKYNRVLVDYTKALGELDQLETDSDSMISEKENNIKELRSVLMSYQESSDIQTWDFEQYSLNHEIVKRLHGYAIQTIIPTDTEWADLSSVVSLLFPDFYQHLLQFRNNLTEKEFRVCLLIRLHFIPSEIAVLLNLTKQRVSNMRSAINGKLFHQNGAKSLDKNLDQL